MKIIILITFIFLIGCSKNQETLKWNDPSFTVVRAVITNGMSLGK